MKRTASIAVLALLSVFLALPAAQQATQAPSVTVRPVDRLQLATRGFTGALTVTVSGRFLSTVTGDVQTFTFTQTPNSDGTEATTNSASSTTATAANPVIAGQLISVTAHVSAGTALWGNVYAAVRIIDGASLVSSMELASGVITGANRLAWPGRTNKVIQDEPGASVSVTGTDQAAGVELSETVPALKRWRFISASVSFVTSAAVATRNVGFVIDDGANIVYAGQSATNQTATLTFRYAFGTMGEHINGSVTNVPQVVTPVGLIMLPGWRFRTVTTSLDAGDNWGPPQYIVEQWIEALPEALGLNSPARPWAH